MPREKAEPATGRPSAQMKSPELPPDFRCRHSNSMMKFSYIFAVRIVPTGAPLVTSMPSRTVNVSGAMLQGTQVHSAQERADGSTTGDEHSVAHGERLRAMLRITTGRTGLGR